MVVGQFEKIVPQGLKPGIILGHFMYGLKPVPFKLAHFPGGSIRSRPG